MTPAELIAKARADGLALTLSPAGALRYRGDSATVTRWLPLLCEAKTDIVQTLLESKMNIYLTKYCLTSGGGRIALRSAKASHSPTMVVTEWREGDYSSNGELYWHKPDWHETKEAALAHAETMRQRKIASLRKQIRKLEQMKFVIEG